MTGPLAGLRVVDFGQYVAGPLTAVLLADQGADVIHVDPPGGPRMAGVPDAFLNRGKRRAILDLKKPGELAAARREVETTVSQLSAEIARRILQAPHPGAPGSGSR